MNDLKGRQAIGDLFDRYEALTNEALAGRPDAAAILTLYADAFVGSSPVGVMAGKKDRAFEETLIAGFARNREIGARRMTVLRLRIEPIDAVHALAHVDWRATYDRGGVEKAIDFTNVYLVRVDGQRAAVFGWMTGDEMAELRKHGIA